MEPLHIKLVSTSTVSADVKKCIICQKSTGQTTTSTDNGRKRIREAADIRQDSISKRLKFLGKEDVSFVYQMGNDCYKSYTLQKTLSTIILNRSTNPYSDNLKQNHNDSAKKRRRSHSTPRTCPNKENYIYRQTCVICGFAKHQNVYEKYRISEMDRAKKFLEATVCMQDEAYVRTCDLQDVNTVFGADIYCHKLCIRNYLNKFERLTQRNSQDGFMNTKQIAWSIVVKDIEKGLREGVGYELSSARESMNIELSDHSCVVTNNEVKLFLTNHFGENISFTQTKQANKSFMFFSRSVTVKSMAETIRTTDPVRQCAEIIRQSLLDVNFDLQDRFCDANDLTNSWDNMSIPEPLLKFMGTLFNFDTKSFTTVTQGVGLDSCEEDDDNNEDEEADIDVSQAKCRQMLSLFQTMYYILHRGRKRTPMHILNSQAIYERCKSATLIKSFNRFGWCCSYDEVMRHRTDMAMYTVESCYEDVPFPSHFEPTQFTIAAFDNFDHAEATLSGIGGSHDTVSVLFQEDDGVHRGKPMVSETRTLHGSKSFHTKLKCQQLQQFYKPTKKADLPIDYTVQTELHQVNDKMLCEFRTKDLAWSLPRLDLCQIQQNKVDIKPKDQTMPLWSVANSMLSTQNLNQKRVSFLPVLPYPVTQYDTVYTSIKNFQCILRHLDQLKLPVTCDEGVYHIARERSR